MKKILFLSAFTLCVSCSQSDEIPSSSNSLNEVLSIIQKNNGLNGLNNDEINAVLLFADNASEDEKDIVNQKFDSINKLEKSHEYLEKTRTRSAEVNKADAGYYDAIKVLSPTGVDEDGRSVLAYTIDDTETILYDWTIAENAFGLYTVRSNELVTLTRNTRNTRQVKLKNVNHANSYIRGFAPQCVWHEICSFQSIGSSALRFTVRGEFSVTSIGYHEVLTGESWISVAAIAQRQAKRGI